MAGERVDGIEYTPGAVRGIREELIALRNAALDQTEMHAAVTLSWVVAYLWDYAETLEREAAHEPP